MNVYYVEVYKWLRSNLDRPYGYGHDSITEIGDGIYRSKEMAKKELMEKFKEAQKELRQRKAKGGNCREIVKTTRGVSKEGWASAEVYNRFDQFSPDQIVVTLRTTELIGGNSKATG